MSKESTNIFRVSHANFCMTSKSPWLPIPLTFNPKGSVAAKSSIQRKMWATNAVRWSDNPRWPPALHIPWQKQWAGQQTLMILKWMCLTKSMTAQKQPAWQGKPPVMPVASPISPPQLVGTKLVISPKTGTSGRWPSLCRARITDCANSLISTWDERRKPEISLRYWTCNQSTSTWQTFIPNAEVQTKQANRLLSKI